MFTTGFMSLAFQTVSANDNKPSNAGDHVRPYDRYKEQEYQERIKREKTELERLDSVLAENRRKAELAARNKQIAASERRAIALARAEAEYLAEINRLLMVRADLIRRIREDEAILVIMMMKRRRLRVA
jgi:hypothetical protein